MPISNRWDNREQDMLPCPECHNFMLPLRNYTVETSERPSIGDIEPWEFLLWGWMAFVYGFLYDSLTYKSRQQKVASLRAETLSGFPNSLICPHCLHVARKT